MTTTLPRLTGSDRECCSAETPAVLRTADAERLAGLLKAVADPARLRLLSLVGGSIRGETCVCDLTGPVGLSQPTVSHHLRILVDAGLLTREQRGKWAYYRLVDDAVTGLAGALLSAATPLRRRVDDRL